MERVISITNYDIIATVDKCEDGYMYLTQRNKFSVGDEVELLTTDGEPIKFTINEMYNADNDLIDTAPHALMKLKIKTDITAPALSILRMDK